MSANVQDLFGDLQKFNVEIFGAKLKGIGNGAASVVYQHPLDENLCIKYTSENSTVEFLKKCMTFKNESDHFLRVEKIYEKLAFIYTHRNALVFLNCVVMEKLCSGSDAREQAGYFSSNVYEVNMREIFLQKIEKEAMEEFRIKNLKRCFDRTYFKFFSKFLMEQDKKEVSFDLHSYNVMYRKISDNEYVIVPTDPLYEGGMSASENTQKVFKALQGEDVNKINQVIDGNDLCEFIVMLYVYTFVTRNSDMSAKELKKVCREMFKKSDGKSKRDHLFLVQHRYPVIHNPASVQRIAELLPSDKVLPFLALVRLCEEGKYRSDWTYADLDLKKFEEEVLTSEYMTA